MVTYNKFYFGYEVSMLEQNAIDITIPKFQWWGTSNYNPYITKYVVETRVDKSYIPQKIQT